LDFVTVCNVTRLQIAHGRRSIDFTPAIIPPSARGRTGDHQPRDEPPVLRSHSRRRRGDLAPRAPRVPPPTGVGDDVDLVGEHVLLEVVHPRRGERVRVEEPLAQQVDELVESRCVGSRPWLPSCYSCVYTAPEGHPRTIRRVRRGPVGAIQRAEQGFSGASAATPERLRPDEVGASAVLAGL
jgi:hypothetical protein